MSIPSYTSVKENKAPTSLEKYAEPGGGGVDLSQHKAGQAGFDKCIADFEVACPSFDRAHADLSDKVLLLGDAGVGKTSLVLRLTGNTFVTDYKATIGVDFFWKKYTCRQYGFTLHIWDTAGQERFRSLSRSYYRGAKGCIIAFDLGATTTFNNVKQWISDVMKENEGASDLCIFLAGCKADMFHSILPSNIEKLAEDVGAEYFEVSAKTGQNVNALFKRVATVLFEAALLKEVEKHRVEKLRDEHEKQAGFSGEISLRKSKLMNPMGGGKGIGDPGGGKGTENWKTVKNNQKPTVNTQGRKNAHCCLF